MRSPTETDMHIIYYIDTVFFTVYTICYSNIKTLNKKDEIYQNHTTSKI